jgi:hypothetical protein
MQKLAMIWQLSESEIQHLSEQDRGCEAPNCGKQPDYVLMIDRQPPLVVYACSGHARAWAENDPRGADAVSPKVE